MPPAAQSCLVLQGDGRTLHWTTWNVLVTLGGNLLILAIFALLACYPRTVSPPANRARYGLRMHSEAYWCSLITLAMTLAPVLLYGLFTSLGQDWVCQDIACNFVYTPSVVLLIGAPLLVVMVLSSWCKARRASGELVRTLAPLVGPASRVLVLPSRRGEIAHGIAKAMQAQGDSASGAVVACDNWTEQGPHELAWAKHNAAIEGVADLVRVHASPVLLACSKLPCDDDSIDLAVLPMAVTALGSFFEMSDAKLARAARQLWPELHRVLCHSGTLVVLAPALDAPLVCGALRASGLFADVHVDQDVRLAFSSLCTTRLIRAHPVDGARSARKLARVVESVLAPMAEHSRAQLTALGCTLAVELALFALCAWLMFRYWGALAIPRDEPFTVNCGALVVNTLVYLPVAIVCHLAMLSDLYREHHITKPARLARVALELFLQVVLIGTVLFEVGFWSVALGVASALRGRLSQSWISLVSAVVQVVLIAALMGAWLRWAASPAPTSTDEGESQPLLTN